IGGETDSPRDGAGGFLIDPQREFGAMMIKQMAIATSWDVDGFNIWTYRDFEPPGVYSEFSHCGIVYYNASWKGVTYACNWSNNFLGNGYMKLMPVSFPQPITGIVAKDSRLVDGKDRWVIVAWNPQHQAYIDARVELGTAVRGGRIYDYASDTSTPLALANETGVDIQVGYEPVLLVIDCDTGSSCTLLALSDPAGTFFIVLLCAAIALVVGNVIRPAIRGKLKRKGDADGTQA
nr:hypothetical protein [Candidatus Sigynarchaeota archaeon]